MARHSSNGSAIRIINAVKSYGNGPNILNGLYMNVPIGSIYGLLGPSGCGKTTLLNLIIGSEKLNSGIINVQVESKMDIGFMPQGVCLSKYLTVRETLMYYGSLYFMTEEKIIQKMAVLGENLDISYFNSLIKDLSGGQSRRVSIAVSLLHDPKIIILDEPTAGLDPLLCYKIWDYLGGLVKRENRTVIISTHYIQEANKANIAAFMRQGRIIKESSPQNILSRYNTDSLEDAFLKIVTEPYNPLVDEPSNLRPERTSTTLFDVIKNKDISISKQRILVLFKKHCLTISRDYIFFFFMYLMPISLCLLADLTIGNNFKDLTLGLQNEEIDMSDCKTMNFSGCIFDNNNYSAALSCGVINYLISHDYNFIHFNDKKTGIRAVDKAKIYAFLSFPKNYTKGVQQFVNGDNDVTNSSLLFSYVDKTSTFRKILHCLSITVMYLSFITKWSAYITQYFIRKKTGRSTNELVQAFQKYNSNELIKGQIISHIANASTNVIKNEITRCSSNPEYLTKTDPNKVYGANINSLKNSCAGFLLVICAFYYTSVCSASFMLEEKLDGLLNRAMITGVTMFEVIAAYLILHALACVVQSASLSLILFYVLDYPLESTKVIFDMFVALTLGAWLGFFFGVFVSAIAKSSNDVMHMTLAMGLCQMFVGGLIWPIEAQSEFMQKISKSLPMSSVGTIVSNAIMRGWSLTNPANIKELIKIMATFLLIALTFFGLKFFKRNPWLRN